MSSCAKNLVKVQTQYGPIQGQIKTSILGRDFYSFQKIPYMKAPVGKLRFTDPQAPDNWTEPLDCTKEGPPFSNVFFLNQQYQGDLSGVHINVFTNNINPREKYPVLFWIHGGGIYTGNATEDFNGPDYLMQKDVILVTFQYRIGIFGFLSLDDPSLNIPGNAQFRDHVFALKWIQNNIENFGGDKNNVTVFGESWGGGSACYHMISEQSRGLFHRAILMSGTALNIIYSSYPRRNWALRLCLKLGYSGPHDDKSILEFLENADEKELVIASNHVMTDREKNDDGFICPFGPTIENYDNGNAFLTDDIIKMAQKAWGNDIDIMIGNTSNECLLQKGMITPETFMTVNNFQKYVTRELGLELDDPIRLEYAERLKRHYYGVLEPSVGNLEGICQVSNDAILWHPMKRIVLARLNNGKGKTFNYRFDYVTKNNLMREFFKLDEKIPGAAHGDDCSYIFKIKGLEGEGFSLSIASKAFEGIKLMTGIVTNFAKCGNPYVDELKDVEWTEANKENPMYGLNISEKGSEMMVFPESDRITIFDEFFNEQKKILC